MPRAVERIAICDDVEMEADVIIEMLEDAGIGRDHVWYKSGAALVEALDGGENFDVVLLDISMPGLNGHETLGRIRDGQGHAQIVVMYSNSQQQADVDAAWGQGIQGFLRKPSNGDDLIRVLEALHTVVAAYERP